MPLNCAGVLAWHMPAPQKTLTYLKQLIEKDPYTCSLASTKWVETVTNTPATATWCIRLLSTQVLLSAIEKKTSADATAAAAESGGPPLALKDRFNLLLQDAAQALRSGLVAPPLTGPEAENGTVESELAPTKSKEPAAAAAAPGSSSDQEEVMALTVENVGAVEGVFSTDIGVDVENEQLCRFLRAATTTTTKISASP